MPPSPFGEHFHFHLEWVHLADDDHSQLGVSGITQCAIFDQTMYRHRRTKTHPPEETTGSGWGQALATGSSPSIRRGRTESPAPTHFRRSPQQEPRRKWPRVRSMPRRQSGIPSPCHRVICRCTRAHIEDIVKNDNGRWETREVEGKRGSCRSWLRPPAISGSRTRRIFLRGSLQPKLKERERANIINITTIDARENVPLQWKKERDRASARIGCVRGRALYPLL